MNSDVIDTRTDELWFCSMHFLRLFLAFIQKLCFYHFIFPKINKRGAEIKVGRGREIFQKLISGGGRLFGTRK